jgi:hypothetical protein
MLPQATTSLEKRGQLCEKTRYTLWRCIERFTGHLFGCAHGVATRELLLVHL